METLKHEFPEHAELIGDIKAVADFDWDSASNADIYWVEMVCKAIAKNLAAVAAKKLRERVAETLKAKGASTLLRLLSLT